MLSRPRALVLAVMLASRAADALAADTQLLPNQIAATCGDLSLRYDRANGVSLKVHGVEMIRGSSLWIMQPGWVGRLYGLEDTPRLFADAEISERADGSVRILLRHRMAEGPDAAFDGTQTITLHPDNRIEFALDFRLTRDVPAIIEWGVGQLNAVPLMGSPYTGVIFADAQSAALPRALAGVLPVEAVHPGVEESTVALGLEKVTIHSRLGPIALHGNEEAHLRLFDYRRNRYARASRPIFWFGRMETPLEFGREYHFYARLDFPGEIEPAAQTVEPAPAMVAVEPTDQALVPSRRSDVIVPTPKELSFHESCFALGGQTTVYVGPNASTETQRAVKFLLRDLLELYDLRLRVDRRPLPARLPPGSIVLGEADHLGPALTLFEPAGLELPDSDEGYLLRVDGDVAAIGARTGRGIFHGVTTLVQLVTVDEAGVALRGADIRDWPSLAFRGVHCLSGKDTGDEISRAVRTLMARFKINHLVWECEYIHWDAAPEIAHPGYGMPKQDAARVVQAAHENLVEITPLVQSLGHSEWIFTNGHNLDITEDPDTPYAYAPTVERSYDFIFAVYEEALELFRQPRMFHIGHDEVAMRGRFPWRSRHTGKSVTELVMMDIDRLKAWFDARQVRLMLWGDMFLARGEAPDATFAPSAAEALERRDLLPKEVMVADWHYAAVPPDQYTSLPLWKDAGFDVVGATWHNPTNIHNQTLQAIRTGAAGMLQTTWAGFNFRIDGNEPAWPQYQAWITAAHYFWSGDPTPPAQLPFSPQQLFARSWSGDRPLLETRAGYQLDLSPVANRSLTDPDSRPRSESRSGSRSGSGWLGYGHALDLGSFRPEEPLIGETRFAVRSNAVGDCALMLSGLAQPEGALPSRVALVLELEVALSELHFLSATSLRGDDGDVVGTVTAAYGDGTSQRLDLVYGQNIFALTDQRVGRDAAVAWTGSTASGATIHLWDLGWRDLDSGKPIAQLGFESAGTMAAPVILAVTGVSAEAEGPSHPGTTPR